MHVLRMCFCSLKFFDTHCIRRSINYWMFYWDSIDNIYYRFYVLTSKSVTGFSGVMLCWKPIFKLNDSYSKVLMTSMLLMEHSCPLIKKILILLKCMLFFWSIEFSRNRKKMSSLVSINLRKNLFRIENEKF